MSVELTFGNFLFLASLIAPALLAVVLLVSFLRRRSRHAHRIFLLCSACLLSIALNSVAQVWFLEPLDTQRGNALAEQARAAELVGKTQIEVREILGSPDVEYSTASGRITWEYKQVPGYWLGSHFQVFFDHGAVYGFEPNDD